MSWGLNELRNHCIHWLVHLRKHNKECNQGFIRWLNCQDKEILVIAIDSGLGRDELHAIYEQEIFGIDNDLEQRGLEPAGD